jgi:hypothetical protein
MKFAGFFSAWAYKKKKRESWRIGPGFFLFLLPQALPCFAGRGYGVSSRPD